MFVGLLVVQYLILDELGQSRSGMIAQDCTVSLGGKPECENVDYQRLILSPFAKTS